jgi:hypothetical protein
MASGDVEELLGGMQALTSHFMDQGLAGGPRQECPDDICVDDIGQFIALLG